MLAWARGWCGGVVCALGSPFISLWPAWGTRKCVVSLVTFALSTNLLLACILVMVSGLSIMLTTASINIVLQTLVKEEMRGRIMSLYTMAFVGMTPIGALVGGAIASRVGAPIAVVAGGLGCLALALWFATRVKPLRRIVLPLYEEMGIIPEVARGLQGASELRPRA